MKLNEFIEYVFAFTVLAIIIAAVLFATMLLVVAITDGHMTDSPDVFMSTTVATAVSWMTPFAAVILVLYVLAIAAGFIDYIGDALNSVPSRSSPPAPTQPWQSWATPQSQASPQAPAQAQPVVQPPMMAWGGEVVPVPSPTVAPARSSSPYAPEYNQVLYEEGYETFPSVVPDDLLGSDGEDGPVGALYVNGARIELSCGKIIEDGEIPCLRPMNGSMLATVVRADPARPERLYLKNLSEDNWTVYRRIKCGRCGTTNDPGATECSRCRGPLEVGDSVSNVPAGRGVLIAVGTMVRFGVYAGEFRPS